MARNTVYHRAPDPSPANPSKRQDGLVRQFLYFLAAAFGCAAVSLIPEWQISAAIIMALVSGILFFIAYHWAKIEPHVDQRFTASIASISTDARSYLLVLLALFIYAVTPALVARTHSALTAANIVGADKSYPSPKTSLVASEQPITKMPAVAADPDSPPPPCNSAINFDGLQASTIDGSGIDIPADMSLCVHNYIFHSRGGAAVHVRSDPLSDATEQLQQIQRQQQQHLPNPQPSGNPK